MKPRVDAHKAGPKIVPGSIHDVPPAKCKRCGRPFSAQEARCGWTLCEHCERAK